jgi:isoleucyl-tRNA synthetase
MAADPCYRSATAAEDRQMAVPRMGRVFDLDGTLVDSVYQHVVAWHHALLAEGIELSIWRIHRRIGMSGGLFTRALLRETAFARTVVNLGHSTRAQSKVKLRQPLARAMIVANDEARAAIRSQYAIIIDELNVKALEFVEREGELVEYRVLPDLKKLGKKLGQELPKVKAGLAQLDPVAVAAAVKANQPVAVNGVSLQPDEVLVQPMPREGLVVAGDGEIVVGLDTALTEALVQEGLAREVVRRVNDLRKTAGLSISDRVVTTYSGTPKLIEAIVAFADYLKSETLTTELREGTAEGHTASDEFDNQQLTITIAKARV